jgi:hypothetical protein
VGGGAVRMGWEGDACAWVEGCLAHPARTTAQSASAANLMHYERTKECPVNLQSDLWAGLTAKPGSKLSPCPMSSG